MPEPLLPPDSTAGPAVLRTGPPADEQGVQVHRAAVGGGLPVATAADARSVITSLLSAVPGDTSAARRDAHLAVTELLTNALRHGGGLTGFRARLDVKPPVLRIEVEDRSDELPRAPEREGPGPDRLGGRGWVIVRRLAASCKVERFPGGGKRITITIPVR
ncbi:ATP-binding protein [Kitasatospora sp. NPDC059146]|uniref:ATP-binding protein n=1 Tax=unclassified Kitasatospora TaxID=2633591 RepID=UPI00367DCA4B